MARLKQCVRQSLKFMDRYPWVIPTFGFVSGVASFFMVNRKQEEFAQIMSVLMLASWIWISLENIMQRRVADRFGIEIPPPLLHYLTQLVHQESLFFVIPFFFITTAWNSGQLVFTSVLIIAAFISLVDPIYCRWLASRRWLYFSFHGITLFAVLLTALPLIMHLPTAKSYWWAALIAIALSVPGVTCDIVTGVWKRISLALILAIVSCTLFFLGRPWIPPASLWLTEVFITDHVNDGNRSSVRPLKTVTLEQLHDGIYAYTYIHAPRGLNERIYHQWYHNGKPMDKIPLNISGGREEGYRSWSHKINFPIDAAGNWQIYVVTDAKQVIGVLRFDVIKSGSQNTMTQIHVEQPDPASSKSNDIAPDKNTSSISGGESSSGRSDE